MPHPKTAALLLAAGAATRFGGGKQLAQLNGKSLIGHVIDNCRAGGCQEVFVVTGHQHLSVAKEAGKFGATCFYHKGWATGQASSVDFGLIKCLALNRWDNLLLLPADMPWFTGEWIIRTSKLARPEDRSDGVARLVDQVEIAVSTNYPEGPGLPALLSRSFIQHCYFEVTKKNLRQAIRNFPGLRTIPSGPHTRDVDYREDLL